MKKLYYKDFDVIVIGAGISGITIAERFANICKKRVLIIDKRSHVGGNCYDYVNQDGILVPKYGPHLFHTSYKDVWKYLSNFTKWNFYEHRVLANVDGKMVPVPVNINTVNMLTNSNISNESEMIQWIKKNTEKIKNPQNGEEAALARFGRLIYEKIFKNYTKKQWDKWPTELDPQGISRIPIYYNFEDRYFLDKYQAMPKDGYTKLLERMLDSPNITIKLKTNYFGIKSKFKEKCLVFYTGPIDKFFDYKYGKLEYRSLKFKHKTINMEYYQSVAVVNYPNKYKLTRITEPKHATLQNIKKTTIIKEYGSLKGKEYYPVLSSENNKKYLKYKRMEESYNSRGIYFIGRLANYKYLNMDQACKNALNLFNELSGIYD